jgi:hypothetical protein
LAFSLKTYSPTVQERTTRVVARMLAKDPAERYESYDELIRELTEAQKILKPKPPRKQFSILERLRTWPASPQSG